jgi:mono/diheme cytochrome c family protein
LRRTLRGGAAAAGLLAGFIAGTSPGRAAEDLERVDAGARIATGACAKCHGVGSARSSPVESAPPFIIMAEDPALTEQALRQLLRTSHETMPDYVFTTREQEALSAYIKSLARR